MAHKRHRCRAVRLLLRLRLQRLRLHLADRHLHVALIVGIAHLRIVDAIWQLDWLLLWLLIRILLLYHWRIGDSLRHLLHDWVLLLRL